MQKIMFNDRFLLTQAVLDGRKTQTRRMERLNEQINIDVKEIFVEYYNDRIQFRLRDVELNTLVVKPRYNVGEVVAVAQSYNNAGVVGDTTVDFPRIWDDGDAGYLNKMFVKSELMPHRIEITNVRLQQLQDITDDECLLEGVKEEQRGGIYRYSLHDAKLKMYLRYHSPRGAYAYLIDAISGKGTWDRNPYVFVYDFELVK